MITTTHKGKYYDVGYSIVNVSELEGELRIDAEYYDPFYLRNEEKIKRKKWAFLREITYFYVNGDEIRRYYPAGIPYLRVSDIKPFFLDLNNVVCVHKDSKIKESIKLENGDILISRSGTLGISAIVDERLKGSIISSHLIRIKPIQEKINSYYLVAFLNSKYGVISILQKNNGAVVPEINHTGLDFLKIPIPSDAFQKFIEKLVLKAYEERKKAEQLYKQAKEILSEELGLKNWKPKTKKIKIGDKEFEEEENISIRMLSEVIKADRMDAEHWEPNYDELEEKIRSFEYEKLYKLASNSYETFNPENCDYFYYLEIANVDLVTGDYELKKLPCSSVPSRAKKLLEEKDILVSTVRPNRNAVAFIIRKDKDPFVASTGFCKLKVTDERILPEYLFVLFKTDLYKELLVRKTTATMYPAVSENDIMQLDIPILPKDTQEHIKDMIMEGFQSKENSKKLLEIAKRTVEIYIENEEDNALKYAKKHIQKLNLSDSGGICNDN